MATIYGNNGFSTLAAGINAAATTITIASGTGGRFPVVATPNTAWATLENAAGEIEIVRITAHAANSTSFTVQRGQQGTTARSYLIGDLFELRLTATDLTAFETDIDNLEATRARKDGDTYTGIHNFGGATAVLLPANTSIGAVTPTQISYLNGVTSSIQAQLNAKGNIAGQAWSGTHVFPANTSIGLVSATEISYLDGVTAPLQTQIEARAVASGQVYTGTHDFTGAVLQAVTRPLGTNDTTVATMAALQQAVFDSANLPANPGDPVFRVLSAFSGVIGWNIPPDNHIANYLAGVV